MIVGGESGDNAARPFDLLWARDIRDACKDAGVACFIKQLGRKPMVDGEPLHLNSTRATAATGTILDTLEKTLGLERG